jgi:hypothetical protein
MKTLCRTNHDATVRYISAGIDDYSRRMTVHYDNAEQLHQQRCVRVPGEMSYVTKWESPQALREWAHENELGQIAQQSVMQCVRMKSSAMMKAYQHTCYVNVCALTLSDMKTALPIAMTLAEVTARYVNTKRKQHDPPGLCSCSNVLATCHASNAPGLFPSANDLLAGKSIE